MLPHRFFPRILWSGLGHKERDEILEIKNPDEKDQGLSVQKVFAAKKPHEISL